MAHQQLPNTPPEMLSIREAALELGVPRSTFWVCVVRGDLPARRVGRQWIIARADLERFGAERKPRAFRRAS
jgi:excisionase family DNA binding protein